MDLVQLSANIGPSTVAIIAVNLFGIPERLERIQSIARQAGVPIIHFGTNTNGMLELIREAGGDVIGVDMRVDRQYQTQV